MILFYPVRPAKAIVSLVFVIKLLIKCSFVRFLELNIKENNGSLYVGDNNVFNITCHCGASELI